MDQDKNKNFLLLKFHIYTKSNKDIFNYQYIHSYKESDSKIKSIEFKITESKYISRNKKNIINCRKQNSDLKDGDEETLFRVRKSFKDDKLFEIISPISLLMKKNSNNKNLLKNHLWYVVKSEPENFSNNNEDYYLNLYDIIKIGLKKYEIIALNINSNSNLRALSSPSNYNISELNRSKGSIFDIDIKKDQYIINHEQISRCRICFETFSSEDNPKLCLCSCKDYIHYECLKSYLNIKTQIYENEKNTVKTYKCNKFNCEVCLTSYPLRFRIPEIDRTYELIDFKMSPELDYVVLESLDYINDKSNLKIIHVIQLIDDEFYIGRNDSNDIKDEDLSVSRKHAVLYYDRGKGGLYLINKSEKFGTLILIKGSIKMKEKCINLQCGGTFITANLESGKI